MRHTRQKGGAHALRNLWVMAFAGAVASLFPASASPAGYVQLTQSRSLTTSASANFGGGTPTTDADSENSAALGSFDRSVSSTAGVGPAPPFFANGSGNGVASQSVQLAPTSIAGSLVGDAGASTNLAEASAGATSTWSTTFRVDQPTPFDLEGRVRLRSSANFEGFGNRTGNASLIFRRQADAGGAEETLYNFTLDGPPPAPGLVAERTVDAAGVLEPGYVYSLVAGAAGSIRSSTLPLDVQINVGTISDVTFTLTAVPEPAAAGVLALGATLTLRRRRV